MLCSTRKGFTVETLVKETSFSRGQECFYSAYVCERARSGCGKLVPKTRADRVHVCPYCGLVLDRDVNAARVILLRMISMVRTDSKPVGDSASAGGCSR
jgi:transposase